MARAINTMNVRFTGTSLLVPNQQTRPGLALG
jgi:hypothetical protein